MTRWKIYNEDVVSWAKSYRKTKFHALLSDPPYHLTTITKRFGKDGAKPAKYGTDGVFQRSSKGFMQTDWDGGDVAFDPATWAAFHDVLYPGAFGMAFSASRNWHRLAVAIEDAGYIIHPTIFLWVNGQGFPKATNISKQLSKTYDGLDMSPEVWEGHRYGLQALKPAVEPIIVFQKPYEGKPLSNIVETGAGALNIDASRIGVGLPIPGGGNGQASHGGKWASGEYEGSRPKVMPHSDGRWPSNLILEEGSAKALDAQTGTLHSGSKKANQESYNHKDKSFVANLGASTSEYEENEGGASRFFYVVQDKIDEADPAYYCGKVSKKERNAGMEDKDFGASGGAQSKIKQGDDEYLQNSIGLNRISKVKNNHPTLKPIDLARYLATLLLPPDEYKPRRILVPFSGVASEMIGAGLAGWDQIVGVEFDTKNGYIDIAQKRLEHWLK